ncbi:outer membrane beta-barrel protein [uncultured Tenacibaculum sp.]|uniref:outer membrane beta-barrel protein n=1 Tax=uncultured Tenacibaculum sp. TaxID=174713 RepID=UPI002633E640|nr:outer membrane beta-barrel protein [uncultured Tenacibaculum sp.]
MKKLLLLFALTFTLISNAQDGGFNLGANFSLPVGNASETHNFALSVEANYLFDVTDNIQIGPSASFINYFGKEENNVGFGSVQFLPVAGAARFNVSEDFTLGADLGYAIGINTGNEGGFYYRPLVAYNISETIALQASYNGVANDGQNFSSVGLGVVFKL